jgi:integrase
MKVNVKLLSPMKTEGETSVFFKLKYRGQSIKVYPTVKVALRNWSKNNLRVLSGDPAYVEKNKRIEHWLEMIKKGIHDLELNGYPITGATLKRWIEKGGVDQKSLQRRVPLLDYYDAVAAAKCGSLHPQTMFQFRRNREHLAKFVKGRNSRVCDLDYRFLSDYLSFLQKQHVKNGTLPLSKNTIAGMLSRTTVVAHSAIRDGLIPAFDFKGLNKREDMDSLFLNPDQIRQFAGAEVLNETEERARDLFLFNCFAGLRYGDLQRLSKSNFSIQMIDGQPVTMYAHRQTKTDRRVTVPLFPQAKGILEKYEWELPKMSALTFNKTIKALALRAGLIEIRRVRIHRGANQRFEADQPIWQGVSSHTARRSFCTNCYRAGLSIGIIMLYSGHLRESQLLTYIREPMSVSVVYRAISNGGFDLGSAA